MLFRKKDNSSGAKAKTSLFARKAVADTVHVKDDIHDDAPKKVVAVEKKQPEKKIKQTIASGKVNADILTRPRITEKATSVSQNNVYVFDVASYANKSLIASAIKDVYGITPVHVRVTKIATKVKLSRRGKAATVGGGKKAYVTLKKGDTIEIV
ncbi:MAG: 50S ribosomal protein L23 [Candidatus Campbellbacteria bacterium]|nr:50S ribosomal protein L23 [Candidatus Campbellbacteria bacterium]